MGLFKGTYIEVKGIELTYDGDYLRGTMEVRTVANGFDNTRTHEYPDCYGKFVQGFPMWKLEELRNSITQSMIEDLETIYGFSNIQLEKIGEIPLIETKN